MKNRSFLLLVFCVALLLMMLPISVFAKAAPDHTQTGSDITVGPNEEAGELTCFGCSVRVRGHVLGDVTTFGGSVVVEEGGQIDGEATTFAGGVRLDKGVTIKGDVTVFGGRIRRDPTATIIGEVTNFGGTIWVLLIFGLPFLLFAGFIAFIIWLVYRLTRRAIPAPAQT